MFVNFLIDFFFLILKVLEKGLNVKFFWFFSILVVFWFLINKLFWDLIFLFKFLIVFDELFFKLGELGISIIGLLVVWYVVCIILVFDENLIKFSVIIFKIGIIDIIIWNILDFIKFCIIVVIFKVSVVYSKFVLKNDNDESSVFVNLNGIISWLIKNIVFINVIEIIRLIMLVNMLVKNMCFFLIGFE